MMVNSQIGHYIGSTVNASGANTLFIDAYLAEVTFIDGTALDASSFGQFKAGVWSPKPTSDLTFGVNGFYLRFKSTDINSTGSNRTDPYGSSTVQPNNTFADNSGRGNHLTFSGVAATDVVLDSPTNNFATMNPLMAMDQLYKKPILKYTAILAFQFLRVLKALFQCLLGNGTGKFT